MIKRVGKRGDTLIEVTLAVGIFSMIAIAIVAVMSNGTSSAQTALETTLAREEVDAQVEALRFIQSSYIGDIGNSGNKYAALWKQITDNAIVLKDHTDETVEEILQYMPASCSVLYDKTSNDNNDSIYKQNAFIINTHAFPALVSASEDSSNINDIYKEVLVTANDDENGIFRETTTYPRLIYNNNKNKSSATADLDIDTSSYSTLSAAEGIYVIAVKDNDSTNIVGSGNKSAFYDFYIRTCWYGSNANEPSTVSTVMRLYEPSAVKSSD